MMPDQSQGSCQAIEDAAALGLIFHTNFPERYSVAEGLKLYEKLRKPRATKLQAASIRARNNLNERIGWSSASDSPGKLTIEEVCGYNMEEEWQQLFSASNV